MLLFRSGLILTLIAAFLAWGGATVAGADESALWTVSLPGPVTAVIDGSPAPLADVGRTGLIVLEWQGGALVAEGPLTVFPDSPHAVGLRAGVEVRAVADRMSQSAAGKPLLLINSHVTGTSFFLQSRRVLVDSVHHAITVESANTP